METLSQSPTTAPAGSWRAFQDGLFRVLVAPEQTHNTFGLLEMELTIGAGPPRHQHTYEDETICVLEGELSFQLGNEVLLARAGQAIFGPRQVPHQFKVISPRARILMLLTPGQFANYFIAQGRVLNAESSPPRAQGPPTAAVLAQVVRTLRQEHGVHLLP